MLWEIGQDAIGDKGDYSLLHFVHTTALTEGRNFLPKIRKFTIEQSNESIVSIRLEDQVAPGSYLVLEDIIGTANQKIDLCHGDSEVNVDLTIYPHESMSSL